MKISERFTMFGNLAQGFDAQILQAMELDGAIGSALRTAASNTNESPARTLACRLHSEFSEMIGRFEQFQYEGIDIQGSFLRAMLNTTTDGRQEKDCVLQFLLASHAKLDSIAEIKRDRGWKCYQPQFKTYDAIFSALLPIDWRSRALELAKAEAYRIGTNDSALQDWDEFDAISRRQESNSAFAMGPSTGLRNLDAALGGLWGTTFIGGDRGVGKTCLLIQMMLSALRNDPQIAILCCSLDMEKTSMYRRIRSHVSGIDFRALMSAQRSDQDERRWAAAEEELRGGLLQRLKIIERTREIEHDGLSFEHLVQQGGKLMTASGAKKLFVVFDLFQRIDCPPEVPNEDQDQYRLDLVKQLKRETSGGAMLIASEIRKGDSSRMQLCPDDLLGAGRMASDADNILLLWPTTAPDGGGRDVVPLNLRIAKGRDGVQRIDVPLWFAHTRSQFSDTPPAGTVERGRSPRTRGNRPSVNPLGGRG